MAAVPSTSRNSPPGFKLLTVSGIPIRLHLSWFVVLALVTWSLATGWFPQKYPELGVETYWVMGVVGAVGLFVSIVLHELGHAFTARRLGLPMGGITLFIFGGVAEMQAEPPDPRTELMVAVAGPIVSVAIAFACWAIPQLPGGEALPVAVRGTLGYLSVINAMVVVFNLMPGFPLDGGRVFRAILWMRTKDLTAATRAATQSGAFFGALLIGLALLSVFAGNLIGGMWLALIGLFLRGAAQASYQQHLLRGMFAGEPVSRFAQTDVKTVPSFITILDLVEDHVYRHHFKMFPVVDDGHLLGCVTTRHLRQIPKERWGFERVSSVTEECSAENTIGEDADTLEALSKMQKTGRSRLMLVTPDGQLAGILSLKDLLAFFQLKLELGVDGA